MFTLLFGAGLVLGFIGGLIAGVHIMRTDQAARRSARARKSAATRQKNKGAEIAGSEVKNEEYWRRQVV